MIKVRKHRVYKPYNCGKRDVGIHSIQHCETLIYPQITNITRNQPVTTYNKFQNLHQEEIKYIADTPQITKPQLIRRTRWDNSPITKARTIVNQINNKYRDIISHSSNTMYVSHHTEALHHNDDSSYNKTRSSHSNNRVPNNNDDAPHNNTKLTNKITTHRGNTRVEPLSNQESMTHSQQTCE